jgi:hypothetical protein
MDDLEDDAFQTLQDDDLDKTLSEAGTIAEETEGGIIKPVDNSKYK